MVLFWTLAAFIATTGIALLVGLVVVGRPKSIGTRLEELMSTEPASPIQSQPNIQREDAVPFLTKVLTGRRITDRLVAEISAAGLPIRPSEFVGIIVGAGIISQLLAFSVANSLSGHLLLGLIGCSTPIFVLKSLQRKRREAFDAQIVDALVTMSASFRSGFALLKAMQMVAQEMRPPISKEFERVVNEVGVGRPLEDSLRAAVARIGSYDFDLVVTAILIHMQVGGNLAVVMETIADTIRERRKIQGEMKALTAEGRMSGIVLVVLPLGLATILCLSRPQYMAVLWNDPIGPPMVITVAVLQILGILIMRRMLALDI